MQVYYFDELYLNRLEIVNGCVVVEYLATLFSLNRTNPNPFDNARMIQLSSVNLALNPHEFRMVWVKNKPLWLNWRQIIYTWAAFEHNSSKWMFCGNEYNRCKRAYYVDGNQLDAGRNTFNGLSFSRNFYVKYVWFHPQYCVGLYFHLEMKLIRELYKQTRP